MPALVLFTGGAPAAASRACRWLYGTERTCAYPPREGGIIQYRITDHHGQAFGFENYYLAPVICEAAARDAGFYDFR